MTYSTGERISHCARRLGFGSEPDTVNAAATVEDAISLALDVSTKPVAAPHIQPPENIEQARSREQIEPMYRYWLEQLVAGPRGIEERLVWFWHDHFATDLRKVRVPYLMYRQHLTLRAHATGSFANLLHAIAVDPAMLVYLDGVKNAAGAINENFGREVMELFTVGRGAYSEEDVIAASKSFSGWVVARPGMRTDRFGAPPWTSLFVPFRHDSTTKTMFGASGNFDAAAAVELLLSHPATADRIAAKLYEELVGLRPDDATTIRLGRVFRREYRIMDLVEEIAADPGFITDDAIRSRVRAPLEKAVGIVQAFGASDHAGRVLLRTLETIGYLPLRPPNVGGFPKGRRLLGPHQLVHTFDLAALYPRALPVPASADILTRLGIYDVSTETMGVLDSATGRYARIGLAINSPEYHVT